MYVHLYELSVKTFFVVFLFNLSALVYGLYIHLKFKLKNDTIQSKRKDVICIWSGGMNEKKELENERECEKSD